MNTIQKLFLKIKFKWMLFKLRFKKQKTDDRPVHYFIYEQDNDDR